MTDQQAAQTDTGTLLECPFCASTDIDPEGWASTERSGPACQDCGASADTVEIWNTRPALRATTPATADARDVWMIQSLSRLERVRAHRAEFGSHLKAAIDAVDQYAAQVATPPARPAGGEVEREALAGDISKGDDTDTSDWDDCLILADHLIASGWKRLASPGGGSREEVAKAADAVVLKVNEYDDRTSPEDWPEALLITSEELHAELMEFAATILALRPSGPQTAEGEA